MEKTESRLINLYDNYTNKLVQTNAPSEVISDAIEYKNQLLENDDPNFICDFEAIQDYIWEHGYEFEDIGYVEDLEAYYW